MNVDVVSLDGVDHDVQLYSDISAGKCYDERVDQNG